MQNKRAALSFGAKATAAGFYHGQLKQLLTYSPNWSLNPLLVQVYAGLS